MLTGVILDEASLGPDDIDLNPVLQHCQNWQRHRTTNKNQTIERCQHADIVVSNKVLLDAQTLRQCPRLKLIAIAATGSNNVDLDAAKQLGIVVCNVAAYGTASVAQHCWALILNLAGSLKPYDQDSRNGKWSESPFFCLLDHPIIELQGKTLGIIGHGAIGQAVANIGRAFGMNILISARPNHDATEGRTLFTQLLRESDIVSLHCPLNDATANIIGSKELEAMKNSAMLINCSRGGLIDESALIHALKNRQIFGAALDTLSQEPPPKDLPILAADIPKLLLSPHSAWASQEARQRLVNIMGDNIASFLAGTPKNQLT